MSTGEDSKRNTISGSSKTRRARSAKLLKNKPQHAPPLPPVSYEPSMNAMSSSHCDSLNEQCITVPGQELSDPCQDDVRLSELHFSPLNPFSHYSSVSLQNTVSNTSNDPPGALPDHAWLENAVTTILNSEASNNDSSTDTLSKQTPCSENQSAHDVASDINERTAASNDVHAVKSDCSCEQLPADCSSDENGRHILDSHEDIHEQTTWHAYIDNCTTETTTSIPSLLQTDFIPNSGHLDDKHNTENFTSYDSPSSYPPNHSQLEINDQTFLGQQHTPDAKTHFQVLIRDGRPVVMHGASTKLTTQQRLQLLTAVKVITECISNAERTCHHDEFVLFDINF
eukprot:gene8118-10113_t